jgi:hypothetical protein
MSGTAETRIENAVADLNRQIAQAPLPEAPVRAPMRWGRALAAGSAIALALAAIVFLAPAGPQPTPAATTTPSTSTSLVGSLPSEGPVFGEPTGVLLLFDDGIDGLTAVDLDRRLAGRSVVEGQRAGDERYSMVRVGEKLVVGWSEPHSVDIATRDSSPLGAATVFVPAAEPGRVWMIDSGRPIGDEPLQVWQVDVITGQPLSQPVALEGQGDPQIGIVGGLALETEGGVNLWHEASGEVTILESDGYGVVHDVHAEDLVWCGVECDRLRITDTVAQETQELELPDPYTRAIGPSQMSPSGRFVAVLLGNDEEYVGQAVWILDRETGSTDLVSDPETSVDFLTWSPDGDQLFATSYSCGESETVVWRYGISDQDFTSIILPFGGAMSPVAVDASVADAYISENLREMEECRAPTVQPSGRTEICSFGF